MRGTVIDYGTIGMAGMLLGAGTEAQTRLYGVEARHIGQLCYACFLQKQKTGWLGLQPAVVNAHLLQSVLFRNSVWSG